MGGFVRKSIPVVAGILIAIAPSLSRAAGPATSPAAIPPKPQLTQDQMSQVIAMPAEQACDAVFKLWAGGNAELAEGMLIPLRRKNPKDQRMTFFAAACRRGYFSVDESHGDFVEAATLDPASNLGQSAKLILDLDADLQVPMNLSKLILLTKSEPTDPLILWMAGVECRAKDANALGVDCYERLCKLVNPGPGIVHQTYANLLDELKQFDEALPRRQLAVALEPAGWTYHGLGNTLYSLERYDDACGAFIDAIKLDPNNLGHWGRWGDALQKLKKFDEAVDAYRRATEIDPGAVFWRIMLGYCLDEAGRTEDALKVYEDIHANFPNDPTAPGQIQFLQRKLAQREKPKLPGGPTTARGARATGP